MQTLKIIGTSILLAILYGICHDLVTAHLSVEYFTIGHAKVIDSDSPIMLALAWGFIATWWVGLILGVLISIATRMGNLPKLKFAELIKPMLILILIMVLASIIAGLLGYFLAKTELINLVNRLAVQIEPSRHHLFLTAGWAHSASYIVGFLGSILICVKLWKKRKRLGNYN